MSIIVKAELTGEADMKGHYFPFPGEGGGGGGRILFD